MGKQASTVLPTAPEAPAANPVDEFVYAISHDLRGPLLNFHGFLRRLSSACGNLQSQLQSLDLAAEKRQQCAQVLDQKVWPSLEVLERNAGRMDRLLAALLDLSRAGREPPQFRRVSAGAVAEAVVEEFRAAAAERQAVLALDPLPHVWADPSRLQQIFRHLLNNALKFVSPERPGVIRLGGESNGGKAVCWVKDNGIGIKPEDQQRIFLPFGRVQEIESSGAGTGLATVRKLMGQQGGRVWVESVHHQGSTFYLSFADEPPLETINFSPLAPMSQIGGIL